MGNFVNDERKYENTMPVVETPRESRSKIKRSIQLRKKRGEFKMKKIKKKY